MTRENQNIIYIDMQILRIVLHYTNTGIISHVINSAQSYLLM